MHRRKTASYDFGPTHVSTSLGAQLQTSQSQSDSKAYTTSYQTVQRAVKSVTQQVTTVQSQRTKNRDSTYDEHKLQNTGNIPTVGMYRWLTEVHYAQLIRYPNRFVLEFEIPEPGAWLRWAFENQSTESWDNPDPGPFRLPGAGSDLSPSDITVDTYMQLAQQWRVRGLGPPPPNFVYLNVVLSGQPYASTADNQQQETYVLTDDSLSVPAGYGASRFTADVSGWVPSDETDAATVYITVGGGDLKKLQTSLSNNDPTESRPSPAATRSSSTT